MKNILILLFVIIFEIINLKSSDKSQFVFYWGDFDSFAARFDVSDSVEIDGVTILTYGDSTGAFRVRVLGEESGSSYPVNYNDRIEPITVFKDKSGYQEFKIKFKDPTVFDYPQLFIMVDSIQKGITIVSDENERAPVCVNGLNESFFSQLLHSKSENKWIYGKYSFIIEPHLKHKTPVDKLFNFDEKLNQAFIDEDSASNSNIAVEDFNNDGYLDIIYGGKIFINKSGIGFDTASEGNYRKKVPSSNIVINDSRTGQKKFILLNCLSEKNQNYIYDFESASEIQFDLHGGSDLTPGSYSVTDLDGDGTEDIAMILRQKDNFYRMYLLLNKNGSIGFENINHLLPQDYLDENSTLLAGDFDRDGNPDIFITGRGPGLILSYFKNSNKLKINDFALEETYINSNFDISETSGSSIIDYNGDGNEDIICIGRKGSCNDELVNDALVYILDESGKIADIRYISLGIESNQSITGGDLNNDGRDDIFVSTSCNCKHPQIMMANNGKFENQTINSGIPDDYLGEDALLEDINNDGKLDLISLNGNTLKIFTNEAKNTGNYLEMDFVSMNHRYKTEVFAGNKRTTRTLVRGRGFLVQGSPRLYFGLGSSTIADSVKIYEDQNLKYIKYNLPLNKIYPVSELNNDPSGSGEIEVSIVPNPFNTETKIICHLPNVDEPVHAFITNLQGSVIAELINQLPEGSQLSLYWKGLDDKNEPVSDGLYLFNLVQGSDTKVNKIIKIR